jgi:carotenoid cleavage dioxygenase-like enzyme
MVIAQPVLPMEGSLPPDLQGTLFRVGPAGRTDVSTVGRSESDGGGARPGALHAIELRDGAAVSYVSLESDADAGVFWHAGSVLALPESGLPSRYTRSLDPQEFAGSLQIPIASHTHRLAADGGRVLFSVEERGGNEGGDEGEDGALEEGIWLLLGEWDAAGAMRTSQAVALERATWQHDIAVTTEHVVFIESPTARVPGLADPVPFGWLPGSEGWVGVARRGGQGNVRWLRYEPALVTHVLGAWEDGDDIVLYACCYRSPEPGQPIDLSASVIGPAGIGLEPIGRSLALMERWRLQGDRVERTQVDERTVEYPRMDPVCEGGTFRYGYCVETAWADGAQGAGLGTGPGTGPGPDPGARAAHPGLLRFDLQRDDVVSWTPGPGRTPSEPIFVRARDGHGDDEGWLLSVVDDPDRRASDLYLLDASSLGRRGPEAVIHLPARLPFRSHGEWVPADRYR